MKKAALELSERYRKGLTPYLRSRLDREAYMVTRFPATGAALKRVFQEIGSFPIQTLLDVGAGPGTSWDAAKEVWPHLERAVLIERDRDFIDIGSRRIESSGVKWVSTDVTKLKGWPASDLVLFSYSWGEIENFSVLEKAWKAAEKFLVVVEPGTPRGYEKMLQARDFCIQHGGFVKAPCPHSKRCPWQGTKEWCHFQVRLPRTTEHRLAKEGSLGYEDEKFSYVIVGKQLHEPVVKRVLRDPAKRKGHTIFTLCTPSGIEQKVVSKKDNHYKQLNKLHWGDSFSLPS